MPEDKHSWRTFGEWKSRYSKLYTTPRISLKPREDDTSRISFMSNDIDPYAMLLQRMRSLECKEARSSSSDPRELSSFVTALNHMYNLKRNSEQFQNLGAHDTMLLNLVRQKSSEMSESQDKPVELSKDLDNEAEGKAMEPCTHGLSIRMTDRSVSRSRFSRMSTRRDMDIPSILAFSANITAPEPQTKLPAFQKGPSTQPEELPKWSIRRSVCPVCSQKWKDKSFLGNVKYSGLKRNSSILLPSVVAPARLRTSITRDYAPRPLCLEVKDLNASSSSFRNSSGSWQLARARRLRIPKSIMLLEETNASKTIFNKRNRIDFEQRVKKFLSNNRE